MWEIDQSEKHVCWYKMHILLVKQRQISNRIISQSNLINPSILELITFLFTYFRERHSLGCIAFNSGTKGRKKLHSPILTCEQNLWYFAWAEHVLLTSLMSQWLNGPNTSIISKCNTLYDQFYRLATTQCTKTYFKPSDSDQCCRDINSCAFTRGVALRT